MRAVETVRDKFREALKEADSRAAQLERQKRELEVKLNESEERVKQLRDQLYATGFQSHGTRMENHEPYLEERSDANDVIPAANIEKHIDSLSRAPSILAETHASLAASLQSAATSQNSASDDEDEDTKSEKLARMHQTLLKIHVGLIMHRAQEHKLQEHRSELASLSPRDAELAWFWYRGAIAALGGALRGRTSAMTISREEDDERDIIYASDIDDDDDRYEAQSSSEEDEEPGAQHVVSLDPFRDHMPYWKHPYRGQFPDLEPFGSISRHPEDYCGPSDESNWVLPGMLLVGAFPGCPDDEENWELITGILSLGVTTFVCLQDEYSDDAPEEDWRYERNGAIRPYFRDVREIVKQVEADPNDFPQINITSSNLHFVHFPIIDCDIGEDSDVYHLAVDLVTRCANGEVLYLHCWGGHGRTGSLVCIMLHLMYGLSSVQAMERCQFVHDLRRVPMDVPSPQKPAQRNQVRRIIRALETVASDKVS